MKLPNNRKLFLLLLLLIIAFPIFLLALKQTSDNRSRAATADKLEAEGGVIGGNVITKQDSLASDGGYIEFGTNGSISIGPQAVASTPLSSGTKFVSPTGTGTSCTQTNPCSLITGANNAVGGDVVFMRGGVYNINDFVNLNKNTTTNYITFESYPGENAILDGTNAPLAKDYIRLYGNYYKLRKFEVRNMPEQGIMIMGNHNIIDGIYTHHNKLSGINIYSPSSITDGSMGSYNTIQNVTSVDNSDAGITGGDFNDGGNADGIAISGGRDNLVLNVLVARNSDDGFDSWRSANSRVAYSISTGNGLANGNGIGFKLGGIAPSGNTQVDHSIAYDNRTGNFDPNGGENVTMLNVTSYNSRDYGVYAYPTTTIKNSISVGSPKGNIVGQNGPTTGTQSNNSWQRGGTPTFISTDPTSPNFLKPTAGGGFEDIGAYAGISSNPTATPTKLNSPTPSQPQTGTIYNIPTNIDDTGNTNVKSSLQSFIDSVPDGTANNPSIIKFPAGKTYQVNPGLSFKGKKYITIDGSGTPTTYGNTNGATIKETGGGTPSDSIFNVSQADHIIIKNINGYGSNPSPATVNAYSSSREYQMGVISYGGTNIEIANVIFDNLNGDGLYMSDYSNGSGAWSENIWMHNSTVKRNGRMGVAWIAANNVTIENNSFSDIALDVWDFEPNYSNQGANGATMKNNVVGDYGWSTIYSGYLAEDANVGTYANITIEGNTINGVSKSNNFAALSIDFDSAPAKTGTFIVRNNVTKNAKASPPYPVSLRNVSSPVLQNNTGNLTSGSFYTDAGENGTITSSGNN